MNGYKYFTCSTSSLERVFMEIVRMSEQKESQPNENNQDTDFEEIENKKKENFHINIKSNENGINDSVDNIS